MSSSRRGGDRGKGIAQDQDESGRRKSRRPSRRDVMDEVSRQTAMRLQVSCWKLILQILFKFTIIYNI